VAAAASSEVRRAAAWYRDDVMRLLVTGTNGQLARALLERAGSYPDILATAIGRPQLDFENSTTVLSAIASQRPDLIVNAAAYTAVDKAEMEPDLAFAINREGAAAAAKAAQNLGIAFIHLSTDYVFSGRKKFAYVESDEADPLGTYGKSKFAGELAVHSENPNALILRTSWVYSPFGNNFVKTMLRLATEGRQLRVVDDQVGNPTSALDLAGAILEIAPRVRQNDGAGATLHIAGSGSVSWYGLARHIMVESRSNGGPWVDVVPIATSEYPTPAPRPPNSRLNSSAFSSRFGLVLPDWQVGVSETVRRLVTGPTS
jgi:dTDP-4-dehydrorhamnose reductase